MTRFVVRCNQSAKVMGLITSGTLSEAQFVCQSFFTKEIWPMGVELYRAPKGFRIIDSPGKQKRVSPQSSNFSKFTLPGSRRKFA